MSDTPPPDVSARLTLMASQRSVRHTTGVIAAAVLALTACGAGGTGSAPDTSSAAVVADDVAIDPAADLTSNLLPDLVVDNLNDDNKVNLRNYGVGDKPLLIWMWAPH